jgi:hypothetical protein
VFRRSPRQRANQASARVPTRHAGVRAPQWIQHFVRASQKLSGIGMESCAPIANRRKHGRVNNPPQVGNLPHSRNYLILAAGFLARMPSSKDAAKVLPRCSASS